MRDPVPSDEFTSQHSDGRGNRGHPRSRICSSRRPPSGTTILPPSPPPSRLRIDPFPLPLFPSLRVSRFIRPVRNPEIAHAHRRATSSTISDGTSSRAFLGGWISIDRPEMFSTWNLFSRLGMRDEEKEKRIIPYRIESRFLSFFQFEREYKSSKSARFLPFCWQKKKKKRGKGDEKRLASIYVAEVWRRND